MQVVRLDTESSRKTAANGKFFQITAVPTMVIMYEDGNTQLFLGTPKIVQWLTALIKTSKERERVSEPEPVRHQEQNMYGPISTAYPLAKTRRPIIDQGEDIEDHLPPQPVRRPPIVEEDYPEEPLLEIEEEPEVEEEKPKPRRTKKGKSRQQKPVEEDGSAAAKRRMAKEKLNKAASAKSKPLSSKMKDVYNMAKQMEEEAKNSYGYKEEDLPHY